jgi:acetamidase/formamidase
VHLTRTHHVWDHALEPVAHVDPGTTLTLDVTNASGGQVRRDSPASVLASMDLTRVNPVTGPVHVAGAEPGDALVVDVLDVDVADWGWTGAIPGFGLLADEFPDPHLRVSRIAGGEVVLPFGVTLPVVPMVGTVGVAPDEPGEHSVLPPRRWGGNMDVRHIGPGARLVLPVGVPGALLSLGDTHAAQGDGEVCGTGVECSSTVRVRLDLATGAAPRFPVVETHPSTRRTGAALATTGIGPDLMEACRDAVRGLLDEVCRRSGLERADAYLLASVAADLTVSEVVDAPHWVVSAHLETSLLG